MSRGRPQKEIRKEEFEKLCGMQCTLEEIAGWFNCSHDTIRRFCKRTYKEEFCEVYKKLSASGKISLRRNQMRLSEKSAAMAIFLGKQYLGQSDTPDDGSGTEVMSKLDDVLKNIKGIE